MFQTPPLRRSSRPPDAVARSLYVLWAPAATRVHLELASLPATGWAIYTCCQAIKRSTDVGRSGESSQHFQFAEYTQFAQFLSKMWNFTLFLHFVGNRLWGIIYRVLATFLIATRLLFDIFEPENLTCPKLYVLEENVIYFMFFLKEYVNILE